MLRLLAFAFLAACAADPATDPKADQLGTSPSPEQTDPPEPAFPRIERAEWHWSGCNPQSASPLPMSLTVDVTIASPHDHYAFKGQATGCDGFNENGQLRTCYATPFAALRVLAIKVEDVVGNHDEVSIPLADCTDGKWERQ
jgi:hypothetical protein